MRDNDYLLHFAISTFPGLKIVIRQDQDQTDQTRHKRAFRLNFTQRKKCAKNPVELARVKQRQGESTSVYVERYKDECIHVKACPEILKISGFMNGINNPELIKRLNDRVPQTFDELMKRTRSFIQGEAAAADSRKGYSNNRSQEQSRRQSNDQSSSRNNSYRGQRGGRGNDKYTPLTMTPKEILATEGSNFPKPPPMRTPEEQRVGNGYCEYHRQKGHTTNECVQLCQLIDKLVKEGRLDHLVKNIMEGKDKQRSGGKKDAPRDKADTILIILRSYRIISQLHRKADVHAFYAKEFPIPPPDPITPPAILTPSPILEIGKSSIKMHLKHHEEQIEDILNYLDELSFHRIEKMEEGRINGNELKTELKRIRTQMIKLQKKQLGQKDKIAFAHYIISDLEQIIEKIQARHQTDQEDL
ncbi:hypothetical protein Tco_0767657 [Tanacetum coccineum]